MVTHKPRNASDSSTLGTAKYPGQNGIPVEASNNATEAQRRANEMANAMAWLTNPSTTESSPTDVDLFKDSENWWESESISNTLDQSSLLSKSEEMPDLMALLGFGKNSSHDNSTMDTIDEPNKYTIDGKELSAEKKARDLQRSVQWLQNNHTKYVHEDLDYTEEPFQKVDAGFAQWKPQSTQSLNWERYDPMEDRKQARRLARNLKQSLDRFLNDDAFDSVGSSHDTITMKRLKDLFLDWKIREDDGAKELEETLSWWKLHARNYDPLTATDEETDKFMESKRLLAILGWKEDDVWDERNKEMEETLALWKNYKDKPFQDLHDLSIEKINKVGDVLVQIKRDGPNANDMKCMAKEMNEILNWYMDKGYKITDLAKMKKSYKSKFQKVQSLLSLWVRKAGPLPDQRQNDIVKMLKSLEKSKYSIVEKYDGEEVDRFRKLQEAIMNWKTNGSSSSLVSAEAAMDDATNSTIGGVLDWWVTNGEHFDFQTASEEEVNMAQVAKSVLDVWIPSDSRTTSSFRNAKLAVEEIKDGLAVIGSGLEEPERLPDLTIEIDIKRQQRDPTPINWARDTTNDSELLDSENQNSEFSGMVPKILSDEEKRAQEMSSALDWLRHNDTELDADDDMSVALSIATFKKIDVLMPKTGDSTVTTTMHSALEWMRSRTTLDDDTVSSFKKVDDVLTRSGAFDTIKEGGFSGALEWLRKRHAEKAAPDFDSESTRYDNRIEHVEVLPNTKSDDVRRAEKMSSALDWLRRGSDAEEDVSIGSRRSLGTGSFPVGNVVNVDHADHDVNWLRSIKASSHSAEGPDDDLELDILRTFAPVSLLSETGHKTGGVGAEESWRRNAPQDDRRDDIGVALTGTQPIEPTSSAENCVLQVDNEMDWSRTKASSNSITKTLSASHEVIIPCDRNPKQRSKDLEMILQWMRKGEGRGQEKEDKYDPTGDFRRLDSLLSHRPGQDKAARARMIEGALDWCRGRRNGLLDGTSDEVFEKFKATVKLNDPAFGERWNTTHPKEMRLDWMRLTASPTEIRDDTLLFKRPCDVSCIPRDDSPIEVDEGDLSWTMHIDRLIPGDTNERMSFQDHSMVNFTPGSLVDSQECQDDNWIQNQSVEAQSDDETLFFDHGRCIESIPRDGPPTDENLLEVDWLRGNKLTNSVPAEDPFFDRPLDIWALPRTSSLNHEAKVPELSWLRNPAWEMNETEIGESVFVRPSDVRSIPRSCKLSKEMHPFTDWNRLKVTHRESEENDLDRLGDVRSIPRNGTTDEDLPTVIWGRKLSYSQHGFAEVADDFDSLCTFNRPGGVNSIPRDGSARETDDPERNWSRLKNISAGVSDEEYPFETLRILNSIPTAQEADEGPDDDNVEWIRHPLVETWFDEEKLSFDRPGDIRSIPRAGLPKSEEESERDWARRVNKTRYPNQDISAGESTRIDKKFPKKKGEKPKSRARKIESTLDWIRSDGVTPADVDESTTLGFDIIPSVLVSKRTPEERINDIQAIMKWMRHPQDKSLDPSGEFTRVHHMLPKKEGQKLKERAREIEGALDWMRNKGVKPSEEAPVGTFEKLGSILVSRRTPEERKGDVDAVMKWMRSGRSDSLDPTGEFTRIDQMLPKKEGQKPENRAREIESTLDWMRSTDVSPEDVELTTLGFKKLPSVPVSKRTPEERINDIQAIMKWMRHPQDKSLDPSGEFTRVHHMLPKKEGQKLKERAREIEGALDWMRNKGVKPSEEAPVGTFEKLGSILVSRRTPEERKGDVDAVMKWMRSGRSDSLDPTGEFTRIDQMLPKKEGQKPENRARKIQSTVDWMRSMAVTVDNSEGTAPFRGLPSIPSSISTPEERENDVNDIMNWLHNPSGEKLDPTGEFSRLDQILPKRKGQPLEDRARDIEQALDWTRNYFVSAEPPEADGEFNTVGLLGLTRRTPEERKGDVDAVMSWMRSSKPESIDSTGEFSNVNQLLPRRKKKSPDDRVPEIERALDWMRCNGGTPSDDLPPLKDFEKIPSLPVSRRSPEKRADDVDNALKWLRNPEDNTLDPTGEFTKIDQLLPKKKSQKPEERAREIEGTLDWMRNKCLTPSDDVDGAGLFEKLGSVPISRRTPEERKDEVDAALNWMRNPQDKTLDPTGEFTRVDQLLPKKKGQKPESRAREIEGALDWIRNNGVSPMDDELNPSFSQLPSVAVFQNSPEDHKKETDNVLKWLRDPHDQKLDPTGEFTRVDQMLPKKKGQKPEDRAREIEGALDWMRNKNVKPKEDALEGSVQTLGSVPVSRRSPEARRKDVDAVLSWQRNGKQSQDDPTGEFTRIDQVIPKKKGQKSEERAREIEGALDWMRNRYGDLRSIPRTGKAKISEDPLLGWIRNGGKVVPGVPVDDGVFTRPAVSDIPRDGTPKDGDNGSIAEWSRHSSDISLNSAAGEENVFDRPGDIRSIPRTGKPHEEGYPELSWNRNPAFLLQGEAAEEIIFDRPGDLRSIPRTGAPHDQDYSETYWDRNIALPPKQQGPVEETNVFDRPGDVRSIPRTGHPYDQEYPEMYWDRETHPPKQRTGGEETVFGRPGDVRSIPRTGRPHDQDYPEMFWDRNALPPKQRTSEEENVFDRPGDIRSIPRDGRLSDENYQQMTWGRNSVHHPEQKKDEKENIFDRPVDIRSIPCDGRLKDSEDPEFEWKRTPTVVPPGIPEPQNVYDRPGDLRSIPRDGRLKDTDELEMNWKRNGIESRPNMGSRLPPRDGKPHNEENFGYPRDSDYFAEWYEDEPVEIPSAVKAEVRSKMLENFHEKYDWSSEKPEDVQWKKKESEYDWSGGRPDQLRTGEAGFDWSDKPEDLWSKKEPNYDWSGARPFERPQDTALITAPTTSLDEDEVGGYEEGYSIDDNTSYLLGEDKPRPITGVPCAAWTMLALGAAAGGASATGTAPEGGMVASKFATNGSAGGTTDTIFPEPGSLPNCSTDANCQIVMDGLSPVIPPDVLGLFDMPGTCQSKARDWLRTGKDILEFKAERIRQRYAMSVFFCEMDGGDWIQGDSWLSDLHECDWYNRVGLDPCNRHEQMEMLRVTDNGLAGTLPVEMFILSNLYEFTLANNLISGSLPQLFDKFKELDTLVIPFNQFEGSLPHQIWEYPDMVYLDVAYNGFSGTIPVDIDTRMPNLNVAFFENNELSGPIPESMGNLQQLRRLHLDDNKFTGTIPSTLGKPSRMSELLLHDNRLTGQVPRELGDLNRLQLLTLHYNSLDEQTMDEHICNLVYNEQLELATVDKEIIDCGCCSSGEESFV